MYSVTGHRTHTGSPSRRSARKSVAKVSRLGALTSAFLVTLVSLLMFGMPNASAATAYFVTPANGNVNPITGAWTIPAGWSIVSGKTNCIASNDTGFPTSACFYGYTTGTGPINAVESNFGASGNFQLFEFCSDGATLSGSVGTQQVSGSNKWRESTISVTCAGTSHGTLSSISVTAGSATNAYQMSNPVGAAPVAAAAPTGTGNTCVIADTALIRLARGAGFAEAQIQIAVAVALAESSGRVNATHYNGPAPGSWDIGLWQINDASHLTYDRNLLFTSPGYNATAAYQIYSATSGGGWTNWTTYRTGAYNKYMSRAANAYQSANTGTLGGNSCADLSGGDVAGALDTGGTTNADGSDNGCGFSLNLFKSLKCTFQWGFVPSSATMNSWGTQASAITSNPPISTVTSGFSIVQGLYNGYNTGVNLPGGLNATGCDTATCVGNGVGVGENPTPFRIHTQGSGYVDVPIIQKIGTDMHTTAFGQALYAGMQFTVTALFGLYWYNRFTSSIGAKA